MLEVTIPLDASRAKVTENLALYMEHLGSWAASTALEGSLGSVRIC